MRKKKCQPKILDISIEESFKQVLGYDMITKKIDSCDLSKLSNIIPDPNYQNPQINSILPQSSQFTHNHSLLQPQINSISPQLTQLTHNHSLLPQNIINLKKFKCKNCNKEYTRKDNLNRHLKSCKESNNDNLVTELENSKKQIEELKKQVEILLMNQKPVHNNIVKDSHNTTINQYIILNAFGKEDMKYITPEKINKLIKGGSNHVVPKLLREIHFNGEHSENHNIYIPNKKQGFAKIYDGENWILTKKKDAIDDMTYKAFNLISDTENIDKNDKVSKIREKYDNQEKQIVDKLHDNTELMILNNQCSIDHP